jgi:AhpD family alkylhydroperoxidase
MSRIGIKSKADLPADLHPLWERMRAYGDFEHQAGVMAHRPAIFKHVWGMLTELADEALLPKRYLELCLLTASLLNKCNYCVSHHAPKLAVAGVSESGAARLLDYHDHPELDATDKLVVEYAIAVTNDWNRTPEDIFMRLKAHFTQAQIVEMTWRTALCGASNRFNDILQIDLEPEAVVRDAAQ